MSVCEASGSVPDGDRTDSRIEPVAAGDRQFLEDDGNAIIEIARRDGQVVSPAE